MRKPALPYYKAYPRDFLDKTMGMGLELKGAYRVLLDVIYLHSGYLRDDSRYISGHLGCSVRKWESLKCELIRMGKIQCVDGVITNSRALLEIDSVNSQRDKNAENGAKSHKNKALPERTLNHIKSTDSDIDKKLKQKDDLEPMVSEAVKVWNEMAKANNLPVCVKAVGKRAVQLKARLKEIGIDGWKALVGSIPSQPFLMGKVGERPFKADIDFLVTDSSFTKIIEGRYTTDRKPIDLTQDKPREFDQLRAARTYIRQMDVYGDKFWDHRWTEHSGLTEAQARLLVSQAEQDQNPSAPPNLNFGAH